MREDADELAIRLVGTAEAARSLVRLDGSSQSLNAPHCAGAGLRPDPDSAAVVANTVAAEDALMRGDHLAIKATTTRSA